MLAEGVMDGGARRPERHQAAKQAAGVVALGGAEGVNRPFGAFHVVGADEGGFAAHGQAHVGVGERVLDPAAACQDLLPLALGVGFGHARRLGDAADAHLHAELDLRLVHQAGDRRGGARVRAGGERDVALACMRPEVASKPIQPAPGR